VPTTYAGEYLPWYATGWDAAAEAWIREQVHAAGLRLTGPIEEVRRWCLACVLRAPTDAGAVFFKEAVRPPVFADEPRFTAALAELYPDFLPQVIAVDAPRSWLLTMDCGAGADQDNLDLLTRYAPLQRRAVDDVDALRGAGCLARPCQDLPAQYLAVLDDGKTMSLLPDGAPGRLANLAAPIADACARLAAYAIPDTLTHGDLSEGNCGMRDGRHVFFDWTDACVTHPFMDGMLVYGMDQGEPKRRAIDAMIQPWTACEPIARLRDAWGIAELVACAHTFVTYHSITAHLPHSAQHEHVDGFRDMSSILLETAGRHSL
jgi:hypothetical protein